MPDGQIADNAVSTLKELKKNMTKGNTSPFFLAVGFLKPHLAFFAPGKHCDMYPPAEMIDLPMNPDVPKDFPPIARGLGELTLYDDIKAFVDADKCSTDVQASFYGKECRVPDDHIHKLRRAYYACISYIDAQIGKVVSELEELGFADDTIIVL